MLSSFFDSVCSANGAAARAESRNAFLELTSETISGIYSKALTRGYDSLGRANCSVVECSEGYAYDDIVWLAEISAREGKRGAKHSISEASDGKTNFLMGKR